MNWSASGIRIRDVIGTALIFVFLGGMFVGNRWLAKRCTDQETEFRACVVAVRAITPGAAIQAEDLSVRLARVPSSAKTFKRIEEISKRRTNTRIDASAAVTANHLELIDLWSERSTFKLQISVSQKANVQRYDWITLVRVGNKPEPLGRFKVCNISDEKEGKVYLTLAACRLADAIAVVGASGSGEWVPLPLQIPASTSGCAR